MKYTTDQDLIKPLAKVVARKCRGSTAVLGFEGEAYMVASASGLEPQKRSAYIY